MFKSESTYHVMYLSPSQRAVLKWLIRHYLNVETHKQFAKVLDMATKDLTEQVLSRKASNVVAYIDKYEQITNGWPLLAERVNNFKGHKSNLYYFSGVGMKIAVDSVKMYDEAIINILLGKDDLSFIKQEISGLQKLIGESIKYTYTKEEVQKALRGS